MNTVQQCRLGNSVPKPRMGHKLSSHWLQRCKPDLSSLPTPADVKQDSHSNHIHTETSESFSLEDRSAGLGECRGNEPKLESGSVGKENFAVEDGKNFNGNAVEEMIVDEHFSSDAGEEEVNGEHVLGEEEGGDKEEEVIEEEEEEDYSIAENIVRSEASDEEEEEEDEDEEGCGGWDGRLQEENSDPSDYLFNPAMRHSVFVPAENRTNSSLPQSKVITFSTAPQHTAPTVRNRDNPAATLSKPVRVPKGHEVLEPLSCVTTAPVPTTSTLGFLDNKESYVSTSVEAKSEHIKTKWKLRETENESDLKNSNVRMLPKKTETRKSKTEIYSELHDKKADHSDVQEAAPHSNVHPHHDGDKKSQIKDPSQRKAPNMQKGVAGDVPESSYMPVSPAFSSSAVSENFVRLNLKVKRFTRKPGGISGSAYKRRMWKKSQRGRGSGGSFGSGGGGGGRSGSNTCFKCGKPGHWAKNCTERQGSKNLGCFAGEKVQFGENMELDDEELDREALQRLAQESPFPSTREASLMARGVSLEQSRQTSSQSEGGGGDDMEDSFQPLPPCRVNSPSPPPPMEPLLPPEQSGEVPSLLLPCTCILHTYLRTRLG